MTCALWHRSRSLGAYRREGRLGLIASLLCVSLALNGVVQAQPDGQPPTERPTVRVIEETGTEPGGAPGPVPAAVEPGMVTNTFIDTDLRQALSDIAAQTGITIVPDDTVQGLVTCEFENAPFEDVLKVVLMAGGFCYKQINGAYLVGAPDPENPSFHWLADTEVLKLNYVTTEDVEPLVPSHLQKFVTFDSIGNRLSITAPEPILGQVHDYISLLDAPPLQVLIELLVVETKLSTLKEHGLVGNTRHLGLNTALGTISYFSLGADALVTLKALVGNGLARLRASPRIVAQDGREAMIEVSREEYFSIVTGPVNFPYTTLEEVKAPIMLKVTPRVAESSGELTLDLSPQVSDVIGKGATGLPVVTARRAEIRLRVADGDVIAIGGLLQTREDVQKRKIPLLGDIPVIGLLFRSQERVVEETEIMIFVVPHILDDRGKFEGELMGVISPPVEETSPVGGGLLNVPGGFEGESRRRGGTRGQSDKDEAGRAAIPSAHLRSGVATTRWLARHLDSSNLRILDLRESETHYVQRHIPGAVYVDPQALRVAGDEVPAKITPPLVKLLGRLGVTADTAVVAYSERGDFSPTYLLWALDYIGHRQAAVLDGGFAKWQAEGRRLSADRPSVEATVYRRPSRLCKHVRATPDTVRNALSCGDAVVLDARLPETWAAEAGAVGQAARVPGIVSRSWADDLEDDGTWKPDQELLLSYARLGVTPHRPVIVVSDRGQVSTHTYVTLRHVLAFPNVANYDGGLAECQPAAEVAVAADEAAT